MNTRRLGLALVAALVVSLAVTSLFYARVRRQSASRRVTRIVAAATALQPGSVLAKENLTLIDWPDNIAIEGKLHKADEITGRVLMYPVAANEPIRQSDLASPGAGIGLSAKIPEGMRAAAVKTNEVNNVAGFVFPGCRVDVLATLNLAGSQVTKTVLHNVQVLSVGEKTEPDPKGKPENASIVTLLLTPEDSEKLALAGSQGTIQLVLRNGSDGSNAAPGSVDVASLVGGPRKAPQIAVRTGRPATRISARYTVETVAGDKKSVASFQ
jgi:pilus assembly protein CpaB